MAVDAETLNDEDSSLMSQSWSEATVAQFDDCCVQIPVKDFMELIPGVDLDDKQKRLLKTFRGFDIKKLPDISESKKLRPLVWYASLSPVSVVLIINDIVRYIQQGRGAREFEVSMEGRRQPLRERRRQPQA